jgi:hypothetical protein
MHKMARDRKARFVTERARRSAVSLAKNAAEMRGIVESPTEADIGDGDFGRSSFSPSDSMLSASDARNPENT